MKLHYSKLERKFYHFSNLSHNSSILYSRNQSSIARKLTRGVIKKYLTQLILSILRCIYRKHLHILSNIIIVQYDSNQWINTIVLNISKRRRTRGMTDKIEIYRARNELKGTRERETERTKGDLLCEFEIEDQYSAKQERERERRRDSPSCERQRAGKTHARDESTEARFPWAVAAAAAGCKWRCF